MRELIRASREAKITGHGSTRIVKCPYCNESVKRTVLPHLRRNHPKKWEQWRRDMLELYNKGYSSMEIARECYMLFTWNVIEREVVKLSEEKGIPLAPPLKRKIDTWDSDEELQRTTVWKFGRRGTWAVHEGRYRGNWPPQVANDLIRRYTKEGELVLDPFMGGGTTAIESWLLGRRSIGLDISPHAFSITRKRIAEMAEKAPEGKLNPLLKPVVYKGDARDLSFLQNEAVDLVCTQPPYLNALKYTEYNPNDLSHIKDEKKFCQEFRKVAKELFRVLKKGRICTVQIGDVRRDGKFIPLGFLILKELLLAGFKTKDIVVKLQFADRSVAFYKDLKKLRIAHEYIFITEKP